MENTEPIVELELFLIRHGQSTANVCPPGEEADLTEREDPMLITLGKEQAEKLGKYMSSVDFDAVYSSGLRRAVQTAGGLLDGQESGKPLNILAELSEIGVSPDYHGQPLDELKKLIPAAVLAPGADPSAPTVVSEKNDEHAMFERAGRVIKEIRERYKSGEKVALVSHAGFLTFIIFHLIGYRFYQPIYDFRLANTGITHIYFYREGTNPYGDMVFDCVNDTAHLKERF